MVVCCTGTRAKYVKFYQVSQHGDCRKNANPSLILSRDLLIAKPEAILLSGVNRPTRNLGRFQNQPCLMCDYDILDGLSSAEDSFWFYTKTVIEVLQLHNTYIINLMKLD